MKVAFHRPYTIDSSLFLKQLKDLHNENLMEELLQEAFVKHTQYAQPRFTGSGTQALETIALAMAFEPGDEVIIPSYTYAATANAFIRAGAKPVFADIELETLNLDPHSVKACISERTKAIVPIHYGGIAANMDALVEIAEPIGVEIVEDAAHGLGAFYKGRPLGTLGTMGCLSFHHTKNIHSAGAGGCMLINDVKYVKAVDQIIHQGTNRNDFLKGEVECYQWQRIGGAMEMTSFSKLYLSYAIAGVQNVTTHRRLLWERYQNGFKQLDNKGVIRCPVLPEYAYNNAHIYYLLMQDQQTRDDLKAYLKKQGIDAYTHYEPLHLSPQGRRSGYGAVSLKQTERVSKCMLRLPLDAYMTVDEVEGVVDVVNGYFDRVKKC